MNEKELIEKLSDLNYFYNCRKNNQSKMEYDTDHPFEKYYNVKIIEKALNKYLNKECDAKWLADWANNYNWTICGGFCDDLNENLNDIEEFLKWEISYNLDGLSFFDDEDLNDIDDIFKKWIQYYRELDRFYKNANNEKGYYAIISHNGKYSESQYIVFINEKDKEFIIFDAWYFDQGEKSRLIKPISEKEFDIKINKLIKKGYKLSTYSEGVYF